MIGVIFNHDMFDDPYKRASVERGFKRLEKVCERLGEHLFTSISGDRRGYTGDSTDEYVIVHHSADLSQSDKTEIADCIKEIHTLKKTAYHEEYLPEIVIVFTRIAESDYFCYNVE